MRQKLFLILSLILVVAVTFPAVSPAAALPDLNPNRGRQVEESPNGVYIVQMIDAPVVGYQGGIPGLAATKPNRGEKINPFGQDVVRYVAYLQGRHDEALSQGWRESSMTTCTALTALLPG
jgi:hypothetical protein